MHYELALKLKNAGFPQNGMKYQGPSKEIDEPTLSDELVLIPTLSELIEACGGDSVIILTIGKAQTTALHGVTGLITNKSTPEEAVANLWLELNKNNG